MCVRAHTHASTRMPLCPRAHTQIYSCARMVACVCARARTHKHMHAHKRTHPCTYNGPHNTHGTSAPTMRPATRTPRGRMHNPADRCVGRAAHRAPHSLQSLPQGRCALGGRPHGSARPGNAWPGLVWQGLAWFGMACQGHGMAWPGRAWQGKARQGEARQGMVWHWLVGLVWLVLTVWCFGLVWSVRFAWLVWLGLVWFGLVGLACVG